MWSSSLARFTFFQSCGGQKAQQNGGVRTLLCHAHVTSRHRRDAYVVGCIGFQLIQGDVHPFPHLDGCTAMQEDGGRGRVLVYVHPPGRHRRAAPRVRVGAGVWRHHLVTVLRHAPPWRPVHLEADGQRVRLVGNGHQATDHRLRIWKPQKLREDWRKEHTTEKWLNVNK